MSRRFRLMSPDELTWEDYSLSENGRTATVVRYERCPGETASRMWTKQMPKSVANRRGLDMRDRYRWTVKKLR